MPLIANGGFVRVYYGITTSNSPSTRIWIRDDGIILASSTVSTSTGALGATTTGIKYTFTLNQITTFNALLAGKLVTKIKWEITSPTTGAATGRINFNVKRNGGAITGVTKTLGTTRNLASVDSFTEILDINLTQATQFNTGDIMNIDYEIEVVSASGSPGDTFTVKINHDPSVAGNELMLEMYV